MIAVRLMGGLGNQMFQYATGLALASIHSTELKLDLSWFDTQSKRKYELDTLRTSVTALSRAEFHRQQLGSFRAFFQRLRNHERLIPYTEKDPLLYEKELCEISHSVLLIGYWQSYKYFIGIRDQLLREFLPAEKLHAKDQLLADKINAGTSVSVHVRRGDYVKIAAIQKYHGLCRLEYYEAAIKKIQSAEYDPQFFIFSDDIAWAIEHIKPDGPTVYVSRDHQAPSVVDMHLMSLCKHNIIANSSFSWWSAWLNQDPQKIVITPSNWLVDRNVETTDLIPDKWISI